MSTFWFIRHGESESNANMRTVHPARSALTARGKMEASAVVDAFSEKPSLIVSSPYLRAQQTAEPLRHHFNPLPYREWAVEEFTYLSPVRYLHTTGTERWPYVVEYWKRNDPHFKDGDEGESFAELMGRVKATISRLQEQTADKLVIFSHGLFLSALLLHSLTGITATTPDAMIRFRRFARAMQIPNCSILKASTAADGALLFAGFDTAHLASLQSAA